MKNERLVKLEGLTDPESNAHVLIFYFGNEGGLLGLSKGKKIQVKMGLNLRAADVARTLEKVIHNILDELKKG